MIDDSQFQNLRIIPIKKQQIENPTEDLLSNIKYIYEVQSKQGEEFAIKMVRLFIIAVLTGLPVTAFTDGKIDELADTLVGRFIMQHNQYLTLQSVRLLKMSLDTMPGQGMKN